MNEIIEKEQILIEDMIYEVRGVQVMLDVGKGKNIICLKIVKHHLI